MQGDPKTIKSSTQIPNSCSHAGLESPELMQTGYLAAAQNEISLRLAYYPAYEDGVEPLPGQLRYGEHTDYTGRYWSQDHGDFLELLDMKPFNVRSLVMF